jgi:hypothetical protein
VTTTHRAEVKQPPEALNRTSFNGAAATVTQPVVPPPVRTAAAKRRVNRRGALLAVLAVLLGGLVSLSAAKLMTAHTTVLVVAKSVPVGSVISDSDLTTAQMTRDPHLSPILAADRVQVVGKIATVALSPGELVTLSQIGTSDGFVRGQLLVALALKEGQFPIRGLVAGDHVLVVATPGTNGTAAATSSLPNGTPTDGTASSSPGVVSTTSTGIEATITDVGSRDATTQITVVDVRVATADGVPLAQLASTGNLALVLLPAGG